MSIYRCSICECYKDADVDDCYEHPNEAFGEICESCYDNLDERMEDIE